MKAVLVVNGSAPDAGLLLRHMKEAQLVIAVDGGIRFLRSHGLTADLLVGDLDSVADEDIAYANEKGIAIHKLPREKDETDTQAALDIAAQRGAKEVVFLGALGSRFDHSFSNVLLLVRAYKMNIRAYLLDGKNTMFVSDGEVCLKGSQGGFVSILPLMQGTVATGSYGLKYPLNDLGLPLDKPIGASNEMTAEEAGVTIKSGLALIVLSQD